MKQFLILSVTCLIVLLTSCKSNELTREKAKEVILSKTTFPIYQKGEFQTSSYNALVSLDVPKFEKLQQAGYITYTLDGWSLTAELTDKGKQFILGVERKGYYADKFVPVKTCTLEFGEVTGILNIPEQNKAEVNYTVKRTSTPFGQYLFNLSDGEMPHKATFKKYDDGWRMEGNIND